MQQQAVINTLERATELSSECSPSEAIAKAAMENRMPRNMLQYLVSAYNNGVSQVPIKSGKTREDKAAEIPPMPAPEMKAEEIPAMPPLPAEKLAEKMPEKIAEAPAPEIVAPMPLPMSGDEEKPMPEPEKKLKKAEIKKVIRWIFQVPE
jgi:hypothetical protein